MVTVQAAAYEAYGAGLCPLPTRTDGSKRPALASWKAYEAKRPDEEEMARFFPPDVTGIGIVTGAISGNLELLDFDDADTYAAYTGAAFNVGLGELVRRIIDGLSDETPSGTVHWYYRCATIEGNVKLAQQPGEPDEQGRPTRKALIETRGEGGYTVVAPSHGSTHATGNPYVRLGGSFATIATIGPDERAALFQLARSFDRLPPREAPQAAPRPIRGVATDERPGDRWAAETTWENILQPHGWTRLFASQGKTFWRRPGKDEGWSATTNYANSDLLYVFSSSTSFEPERGYGKFGAYALLNHDSDFRAAARALVLAGYGSQGEGGDSGATFDLGAPERPIADEEETARDISELPILDAGDLDLPRIAGASWAAIGAINEPPHLFRFGGQPGRLERDDQGIPGVRTLTEDRMRYELARAATWRKVIKGAAVPALPPVPVVRDLLATPDPPLPILELITEVPVFAPNGTLELMPGYHAHGRSYYAPPPRFAVKPVPPRPTARHLEGARALVLDELLGDFPFVDAPEQAHAVALFLLPFVRALIHGPTPLHLIEKPMPGTGASLLADALTMPAAGRPVSAMTEGRDEDEWRKRITSRLRTGTTTILIDNLKARLETASLAAALTATQWEDRLLGTSDSIRLPVRCAWVATGNNPAVSSEIARRTIRIRLDARADRPWLSRTFRHPNLREWVQEERPALVWAALTLAQAWLAEGRPCNDGAPALGMYEGWSRTIGGILEVAGIAGFLGNLDEFYDRTDTEGATLRAFVAEWWDRHESRRVGVAELFKIVIGQGLDLDLGDKSERSQRIKLGQMIGQLRDRHYQLANGEVVRIAAGGVDQKIQMWQLLPIMARRAA